MNKRGQFYIILAVLISLAFFTLMIPQNRLQEAIVFEDFNYVSQNYVEEAPRVANFGLYTDNQDINLLLSKFSQDFLNIARQKNPSLELIYFYNDGTDITLTSYAQQPVTVVQKTTEEVLGADQVSANNINLRVAGKDFTQQVPLQVKDFGKTYYTTEFPASGGITLNIGGVLHNFDMQTGGPEISVLLRSETSPSVVQIYKTGTSQVFPIKF